MRFLDPDLQARLRRTDPTARQRLEAHVVTSRATKQTKADFEAADSLTGLDVLEDGSVRLEDSITTLITNTTGGTNITDLSRPSPIMTALLALDGTEPADFAIDRISAYLNPRVSGASPRLVVRWRLELYRLVDGREIVRGLSPTDGIAASGVWFEIAPLCQPLDVPVAGDAASLVTFDFSGSADRPRPKSWPSVTNINGAMQPFIASPTLGSIRVGGKYLLVAIYALAFDGSAASNVAWEYDAGAASVTSAGNVLSGRRWIENAVTGLPGRWQDTGSLGGTPRMTIDSGSYSAATISFTSGNLLDLGAAPAGDVQLTILGATPPGTALTGQIRDDADSGWVDFADGDFMTADLGLTPSQTRKVQAALAPDSSGALTPTLRKIAMTEVAVTDLSDVAQLEFVGGYGFDPVTLKAEIPRARIRAIRDGDRDYRDTITDLLATTFIGNLFFRVLVGADDLPRAQWMHQDDWYVLDTVPRGAEIELSVVTALAFLKDQVPKYEPGAIFAPDGDQSVGAWTTDAGGGANLYQRIDETDADDTDYVRSELDPAASAVTFTLPTVTDTVGRRLFVEYRYAKDAAAGKTIDLLVELLQGATVISNLSHADISDAFAAASFYLTDAQQAAITDTTDLRLRFTATVGGAGGSRRGLVSWAQVRTGGRRETVAYANQTPKAVYDDLLANQLELPAHLRGPGIEDTTHLIGKTIFQPGQELQPTAKTEVDNVCFLMGHALVSSEGRVTAVDCFSPRGAVGFLPAEEITIAEASPGYASRVQEYFVGWGWSQAEGQFIDEVRAFHAPSIDVLGTLKTEPPTRCPDEVAQWIEDEALASEIAIRTVESLGAGLIRWAVRSAYSYPELQPGDVVVLEAEPFVAKDPNTSRELRGRHWVVARLMLIEDFWGTRTTWWVQSYADILSASEAARRTGREPAIGIRIFGLPGAPQSAVVAIKSLVEGATIYYLYLGATETVPPQLPTSAWNVYSGTLILQRDASTDAKLVVWAEDHGVRSRSVAFTIEHDHTAQITLLTLTQRGAPSSAVDGTAAVDTDVRELAWYRRNNAASGFYPTTGSHGPTDPLDAQYLTKRVPIAADGVGRYQDGTPAQGGLTDDGVTTLGGSAPTYASAQYVAVIAVPYDNDGNVGARVATEFQVGGGATPQILTLSASVTANGTDCSPNDAEVTVTWTVSGVVDGTHDLEVWREIVGLVPSVLLVREASPASTLSFVDAIGEFVSTGPVQTYRYTAKVVPNGGGTALDTKQVDLLIQVSGSCPT